MFQLDICLAPPFAEMLNLDVDSKPEFQELKWQENVSGKMDQKSLFSCEDAHLNGAAKIVIF